MRIALLMLALLGMSLVAMPRPPLDDAYFMQLAQAEAQAAIDEGDPPYGAVLVYDGHVVAKGHNRKFQGGRHAEIECLQASTLTSGLEQATLYTTSVPCARCSRAIVAAGLKQVVSGDYRIEQSSIEWLRGNGVSIRIYSSSPR